MTSARILIPIAVGVVIIMIAFYFAIEDSIHQHELTERRAAQLNDALCHRRVNRRTVSTWRVETPDGWLVYASHIEGLSVEYVPDKQHVWIGLCSDGGRRR